MLNTAMDLRNLVQLECQQGTVAAEKNHWGSKNQGGRLCNLTEYGSCNLLNAIRLDR
jgi:hypothetical protein